MLWADLELVDSIAFFLSFYKQSGVALATCHRH